MASQESLSPNWDDQTAIGSLSNQWKHFVIHEGNLDECACGHPRKHHDEVVTAKINWNAVSANDEGWLITTPPEIKGCKLCLSCKQYAPDNLDWLQKNRGK